MKKNPLFIVLFLSTCTTYLSAQTFGIKGGLNLADLRFRIETSDEEETLSLDTKTSFYIGGFMEVPLKDKKTKFQAELLYQRNGASLDGVDAILSQIQIPLIFKFYAAEGFYINTGGYFSFIIDAQEDVDGISIGINDEFKSIDAGLIAGIEYNLESGFFFDARYNLGLANISDADDEIFEETGLNAETFVRNRVFQLGIGYKF